MIGKSVTRSRIVEIVHAENVPGLYDLILENGERINDLTTRQTQAFVERNGLVPTFAREEGAADG